ncbi:UNVERIFIED_CONTAM: hypothetical protein FKN15_045112 [Acipenser sinensis]
MAVNPKPAISYSLQGRKPSEHRLCTLALLFKACLLCDLKKKKKTTSRPCIQCCQRDTQGERNESEPEETSQPALDQNYLKVKGIPAAVKEFFSSCASLKFLGLSASKLPSEVLRLLLQGLACNTHLSDVQLDLSSCELRSAGAQVIQDHIFEANAIGSLDLSDNGFDSDMVTLVLSIGRSQSIRHLSLGKNFCMKSKKVKGIPAAVKEFFSSCASLKFLGLSASKLPSEVLRLLLQGLACNTHLSDVQLDLSSCELRSAGAQVIQDHIFEANAIGSLDLSDNGFDSDMVTLVLSIGRSQSIRHLSLGKNFCMKSKALADVLCRIVQLIQEEECPLESLSVADSKLKAAGTTILINALGSNPSLSKIDISGNCMGDTGAKMLAKALQINTKLRTVIWDRNNTTAIGFLDVANALEKNYTLKSLAMPVSDVAQASRSNPEKTEEALQKIQSSLLRNNQRCSEFSDRASRLQQGIITSSSEQLVSRLCSKLQGSMASLSSCSAREVQEDIITAEEVLREARASINVQAVACENDENIGNVDEGVEEFFTKKLLPEDPLKSQQPAKAREPTCSASPPSSSKTIKKKFGDFFAFKKPRSARGAKGEGGPESSPSVGLRLKKTSIADLIRPLREAARAAERADESAGKAAAAASVTASAGSSVTDSPALQAPGPVDRERSNTLDSDREKSKTPDADRKLKPSRRSLREGKSQSLILLPGVDADENLPGNHGKKHFSDKAAAEGAQTFEQKVHVMLHRIGVTKVLSSDPKKNEVRQEDPWVI